VIRLRDIGALLSGPAAFLEPRLKTPEAARHLLVATVSPLCALRALAVLLRSLLAGTPFVGLVLALGNFAMQVGAWLGLALVLPALARQFRVTLSEPVAFVLATYASVPLWLAGVFYVLPEDPWLVFVWSRAVVLAVALYGLIILDRGLLGLDLAGKLRSALVTGIAVASLTLYLLLFIVFGIASHILLRLAA